MISTRALLLYPPSYRCIAYSNTDSELVVLRRAHVSLITLASAAATALESVAPPSQVMFFQILNILTNNFQGG
eukprot:2725797-Amphidinium_carterae.1